MSQQNINKSITTVRTVGVLALILSGFVFLMQGYMDWDGFERFLAFSGVNVLVGGFGIFCARAWQEPKGARTMLTLSCAGIAAQFAQLGGMVFTTVDRWKHHAETLSKNNLSSYMKSEVPDIFAKLDVYPLQLLIAIGVLAVVAIPLARLTFKVLTRNESGQYLTLFFINCLILLVPFRLTLLAMAHVVFVAYYLYRMKQKGLLDFNRGYTFEKGLSLILCITPVFIHIGRDFFYMSSALVLLAVSFLFVSILSYFTREYKNSKMIETAEPGKNISNNSRSHDPSFVFGALASICVAAEYMGPLNLQFYSDVFLVALAVILGFGELVRRNKIRMHTGKVMNIIAIFSFGYAQCFTLTMEKGLLLFVLGVLMTAYSYVNKDKGSFVVGCLAMVFSVGQIAVIGLSFDMFFSWINLAIMGITTILGASLMEKKSARIKQFHADFMNHF